MAIVYSIYLDDRLIFSSNNPELQITAPRLTLEAGKAGSLVFTIPSVTTTGREVSYSYTKMASIVEVWKDQKPIFRGRVLDDEEDLRKNLTLYCEGELAYLNDTIVRPYLHQGTMAEYLTHLITEHNSQVSVEKQFSLGDVTVVDANDYLYFKSTVYPSTWAEIDSKLIGTYGGYLSVRRVGDVNFLDYLIDSPYLTGQTITLESNVIDIKQSMKGAELATAVIPIGARNEETDEPLTIASVNGGVDYLFNQDAVDLYGWVFKTVEFSDITLPENLLSRGQKALAEMVKTEVVITVTAADLSVLDLDLDDFDVFTYVPVISEMHGIDENMLIKKMQLQLDNPAVNRLVIGSTFRTLSGESRRIENTIRNIKSDYVTNVRVENIKSEMLTLNSMITQTAESIRLEVEENYTKSTEFKDFKESVSTQFEQTANNFTFSFSNITEMITELEGYTETQFQELKSHILLEGGTMTFILEGDPVQLKIGNSRLSIFDAGVEVAYFSNGLLYITDARILYSLRIGNFQFRPRDNGSLDFGKVT